MSKHHIHEYKLQLLPLWGSELSHYPGLQTCFAGYLVKRARMTHGIWLTSEPPIRSMSDSHDVFISGMLQWKHGLYLMHFKFQIQCRSLLCCWNQDILGLCEAAWGPDLCYIWYWSIKPRLSKPFFVNGPERENFRRRSFSKCSTAMKKNISKAKVF